MSKIAILLALLVFVLASATVNGQDAAFNVEQIAGAIVQIRNLEEDLPPQSGTFVTPYGMIITSNESETFLEGDEVEISVFIRLDEKPESAYLGRVIEAVDVLAVIEITADINENSIDNSTLNLPHYNPILNSVTVRFLDRVFAVSYSEVGGGYLTTTHGVINGFDKVANGAETPPIGEVLYYQSDVTMDSQGLGGPVLTFAGQFVGIAVELPVGNRDAMTDDVLVQIAPVTTLCATMRSICNRIMEDYRPPPENRSSRPSRLYWLTDGIGLSSGKPVPRGEIEVEYYCTMFALRSRTNAEETVQECYSPSDNEAKYIFDSFDYDVICQQTYRNPQAIAIQDGPVDFKPAYRWRCYG